MPAAIGLVKRLIFRAMLRTLTAPVRRFRRPLLFLYSLFVLYLTLAPLPSGAGLAPWWFDKFAHFGIFVGFSALLYLNLSQAIRHQAPRVIGLSALAAAGIELMQQPLPFRSGDWWDLFWGGVGAAVGWMGAEWVERTTKKAEGALT